MLTDILCTIWLVANFNRFNGLQNGCGRTWHPQISDLLCWLWRWCFCILNQSREILVVVLIDCLRLQMVAGHIVNGSALLVWDLLLPLVDSNGEGAWFSRRSSFEGAFFVRVDGAHALRSTNSWTKGSMRIHSFFTNLLCFKQKKAILKFQCRVYCDCFDNFTFRLNGFRINTLFRIRIIILYLKVLKHIYIYNKTWRVCTEVF